MSKKFNRLTGNLGEKLAQKYLKKRGYKVIKNNFFVRGGEIDLVCLYKNTLVFVEVKTKIGEKIYPEEMITSRKYHQIKKTAMAFLRNEKKIREKYSSYRIEAVCIQLDHHYRLISLKHYPNLDLEFG